MAEQLKAAPSTLTQNKKLNNAQNVEPRLGLFWRITLVFVAVTLIWLLVGRLAESLFGTEYNRLAHVLRAVLISSLIIPLIIGARRFLDRRSWGSLGLTGLHRGWRPLLVGMICWLIPAAFGLALCLLLGWTHISTTTSISEILTTALTLLALVLIYEALPEELIFRGYFYPNLATEMPLWLAILVQAGLFTLWGLLNGGENSIERSFLFFTFAVVAGIFRVITGSVWGAVGFHLAFQTFAQLFGTIGNQLTVSNPQTVMTFAFGILPFIGGLTLLDLLYKNRLNWRDRQPDQFIQSPDSK